MNLSRITAVRPGVRGSFLRATAVSAVAAAIGCLALVDLAIAQQSAARQACAADYHTYCSDVRPGGGRILACLKQNADKLSQGCQQALASLKTQH
jgi:hypothetical protein